MKNLFKNIGLVIISSIITILLSELFIRVIVPQRLDSFRAIFEGDEDLVFKLRKNAEVTYSQFEFEIPERINSVGLRDVEIAPKRAGGLRMVGLGDSFSYANGVHLEETYFKLIQNCLTDKTGRSIEIINCAVPAYSLLQEVRLLKKVGMTLEPDAVVLGFYVGNDFIDSYQLFEETGRPTISVENGNLVSTKIFDEQKGIRGLLLPIRTFLATNSHLYIFLRNRMSEFLARVGLRTPPPPPDFCAKQYSQELTKGWELDQQLLVDLSNFSHLHNLNLTIVILPAIYQVYPDAWQKYFTTFRVDPAAYDLEKPQMLIKDFCKLHQIDCVDVLPRMRSEGRKRQLYYTIDTHMNAEGHAVVADTLCSYFSSQLARVP